MKVKNLNASSKKTKELIKKYFVELLHEKRELQFVTVTDLVKKAGITRSTFYTHYDNIYDVAKEFQNDTIELLLNEDVDIKSINDVNVYIDVIIKNLKENENTYKMLLSSDEPLIFLDKIRKVFIDAAYNCLKNLNINSKYLELDMNFCVDGIVSQILKYFRNNSNYTLDELGFNIKKWFMKIFNEK